MGVRAQTIEGPSGHYRIVVTHPNGKKLDITEFRGVPVLIVSYSSSDPFLDSTAVLQFPQISIMDRPGNGDLWWYVPWASVEIRWYEDDENGKEHPTNWVWEGNITSEEIGDDQSIQCKGALYMADNFLSAPFYPQYPVPYERLISMTLDPTTHPTIRNQSLKVVWPSDWNVTVPAFTDPSYLWFLRPWGVSKGQKWSGLTSRSTGSWEKGLTGFVQTLLSTMYTPEGDQWTLMKNTGRQPVLQVRSPIRFSDDDTYHIWLGAPGVKASFTRDWSQSSNVIYGAGQDLAGTSFSGAQVSTDGETTSYDPFAALPQVHPNTAANPRLIKEMTRTESRITFPQGIDELAAKDIAVTQIRRFADPGYTGTITLESDPVLQGSSANRVLIRAGERIMVHGLRGSDVLFHISAVSVTVEGGSVDLTVDTKFRDALTVSEVRARTRDALDPVYLLQAGKQSVTVSDLLKPWSYSGGSGVVPSGSSLDATPLFKKMPTTTKFPWTAYTKKYPPSKYPQYYIKVSRKGSRAADRWQDYGYSASAKRSLGVPVKAAQNGEIRLTQVAAFDRNGNPIHIRFHFGVYMNSGISSTDMPMVPKGMKGVPYAQADRYPLFAGAFEEIEPNGQTQNNPNVLLPEGADQVVAWGTSHDPAGYSPGLFSTGGAKTGQLIDEASWTFDTSNVPGFDKYSVANNAKNKSAGMLYVMIFQDDVQEAYFLARFYVKPIGGA